MTNNQIEEALLDCESGLMASNSPFNKVEADLIRSYGEWYRDNGYLTQRQQEVLESLWDRV